MACDAKFFAIATAMVGSLVAAFGPNVEHAVARYRAIAVVDITQSMNVEDYSNRSEAISRLTAVKQALHRLVAELPCGSTLGIGVFTERRSMLLFDPIEVCRGFRELGSAVDNLDWRMAWAADSRIAEGFASALEQSLDNDATLIFITDGQEAPPINPRYKRNFDQFRGKVKGVIVGSGDLSPSPIPKFDERGLRIGYVKADEVPHRSTFGLSELPPDAIEGYHARNAPFGNAPLAATEHLSALREDYLLELASASGLQYRRLVQAADLTDSAMLPEFAHRQTRRTPFRWLPGLTALAALLSAYLTPQHLIDNWSRRRLAARSTGSTTG